jgi:hypothetical protein
MAELVQSVIDAGQELEAGLVVREGSLWLVRRGERPVDPPVQLRFTDEELLAYYRRVAAGSRAAGEESPWAWWQLLVPVHLLEAIHDTDRVGGPCFIHIGKAGLYASRLNGT